MAAKLPSLSMYLVENDDLLQFLRKHKRSRDKTASFDYDKEINVRKLLSGGQVEYSMSSYNIKDRFTQISFNRGAALVDQLVVALSSFDIFYLTEWQKFTKSAYWDAMGNHSHYEEQVKKILDRKSAIKAKPLTQISKTRLDIVFGGVEFALIDDVFNTNLPLFRMSLSPFQAAQLGGSSYNGFKKIYLPLSFDYFNFVAKQWEPVLEKFAFIVSTNFTEDAGQQIKIKLADEAASINVSLELVKKKFISSLYYKE